MGVEKQRKHRLTDINRISVPLDSGWGVLMPAFGVALTGQSHTRATLSDTALHKIIKAGER